MPKLRLESFDPETKQFFGTIPGWGRHVAWNAEAYFNQRLDRSEVVTEWRNAEDPDEYLLLGFREAGFPDLVVGEYHARGRFLRRAFLVGQPFVPNTDGSHIADAARRIAEELLRDGPNSDASAIREEHWKRFVEKGGLSDPLVNAVGFHDFEGVWFHVHDAMRPGEFFSYDCARGRDGDYVVRHDNGEMSLGDYLEYGVPVPGNGPEMG